MWKHRIRFDIDCDHRGRTGRHIDPRWLPPPSCREGVDGSRAMNPPIGSHARPSPLDLNQKEHPARSRTCISDPSREDLGASEEWARCVAATCSRGLHRKAHRRIHNGPRAGTFCLSNFTLFPPRIQTVIWNTAASLCHSTTDRARQNTAGRFGIVDCRNRSCTRLQPNEFVFGGVPKDHRNLPNRILPVSAMTPGVCGKGT